MGFTAGFVADLGRYLQANELGAWSDTGQFTPGKTGITDSIVPPGPDRLIVLTPYMPDDDPTQAETTLWVQLRTRGTKDVRTSSDAQDAAFDLLHNMPRTDLGEVTVAGCWRRSGAYLGADGNGRHSHTSNYEFRLHRPSPHRS